MSEMSETRLEKIARMVLYDVPHMQIARACGISESRVSQIVETDEFKDLMQSIASERFEQDHSINNGWDTIEATALKLILDKLQWMSDPDFALKAATMANRAQRRGQFNNRPIDGRDGARAVIHLTAQFVDRLQQNHVHINGNGAEPVLQLEKKNGNGQLEQKRQDFLPPERIERLFMPEEDQHNQEKIDSFIGELVMAE